MTFVYENYNLCIHFFPSPLMVGSEFEFFFGFGSFKFGILSDSEPQHCQTYPKFWPYLYKFGQFQTLLHIRMVFRLGFRVYSWNVEMFLSLRSQCLIMWFIWRCQRAVFGSIGVSIFFLLQLTKYIHYLSTYSKGIAQKTPSIKKSNIRKWRKVLWVKLKNTIFSIDQDRK
jgi:hypothetical protein